MWTTLKVTVKGVVLREPGRVRNDHRLQVTSTVYATRTRTVPASPLMLKKSPISTLQFIVAACTISAKFRLSAFMVVLKQRIHLHIENLIWCLSSSSIFVPWSWLLFFFWVFPREVRLDTRCQPHSSLFHHSHSYLGFLPADSAAWKSKSCSADELLIGVTVRSCCRSPWFGVASVTDLPLIRKLGPRSPQYARFLVDVI